MTREEACNWLRNLRAEIKKRQDTCAKWRDETDDENIKICADGSLAAFIECKLTLDKIPTIDIVKCEDCKYNLNNDRLFADPDPIMTYAWCNTEAFQENDFCSKGKRSEE